MRGSDQRRHTPRRAPHLPGQATNDDTTWPQTEDLSPGARKAADLVSASLIEPPEPRAVHVFLEGEECFAVEDELGWLMAFLMLECLERFVKRQGGEIAAAVRFDEMSRIYDPVMRSLKVDGEERRFVLVGSIFVCLGDRRVVVSSRRERVPDSPFYISVTSNRESDRFLEDWLDFCKEHNYLRGQAFYPTGQTIERDRHYGWDEILLPPKTRQVIETHVGKFLRASRRLRALGLKSRRGLILAGRPGTGKTLLGKVLADTLDVSFMWVSPRHVGRPSDFKEILTAARFLAPTVVFLEDLDLFAEERNARGWGGLGELMNQLDGAVENQDIVTIATTNHLDVIEKALRSRPGRFDRVVVFEALDEACRRAMFQRYLAPGSIAQQDLDYLVQATSGCTGAEVEEVVNTLYISAVELNENAPAEASGGEAAPHFTREDVEAAVAEVVGDQPGGMGFRRG